MKDRQARPRQARRKSGGSTLLGIFIGLAIGLLIAVAIAFYISKIPTPFVNHDSAAKVAPAQADRDLAEKAAAPVAPVAPDKPRFDFYRILPGQEVPVSEQELRQQATKPDAPKENYLIQAGAYQSPADADALKARLALLGLEASVEPVQRPDKGTLYRVRLGPYSQLDEINRVRQTLAQNGVEASLMKVTTKN